MGAPYSPDLRKRVVAAIKDGMSRNQGVKVCCARRLLE